ncbi:putative transcription factor C3H family [Helianthus annuus]|uniref:Transcription factor C3H family n=1 Tax=Helianthus annuus TaxID=4232 RepID=A0A9K3E3T1_HELAN|nr:putative transcription factor C3H family [Helianthus annuus]KAJ0452850.1 putative transcription factor C3H family [Helianthus annuus]KAJ0474766.1 putative transcription factor C3H family [Helianthus annuus]KAJ0650320.1 putative transcription factor C3H family [Helianthus annuus]KAJ0654092.1 putative transcription factor C3H family [Helianthus annuus]
MRALFPTDALVFLEARIQVFEFCFLVLIRVTMVRLIGVYGIFLHFWANNGYLLLRMITYHRHLFYYLFSMAVTSAKRLSIKANTSVFKKINQQNNNIATRNHHPNYVVCKYWLQGRCTRNPCGFLHLNQHDYVWKNPNSSPPKRIFINNKENRDYNRTEQKAIASKNDTTEENGVKGESVKRHNLHSWFGDKGLSVLAWLEGHSKDVIGIVFPSGPNNLYCGSKDKSLRVWDCNSGQCVDVINFDEECGTLVEEGPWIFAGLRDMIKAWNRETQNVVVILESGGMVNAITMFEDILFAGTEDGTFLSWKSTSKSSFSDESTSLKGHTGSVLSLIIGSKKLFSGSADCTIRVRYSNHLSRYFDCIDENRINLFTDSGSFFVEGMGVESLECKHVLNGHSGDVTGGVLAFCRMHDSEEKAILLCSCRNM